MVPGGARETISPRWGDDGVMSFSDTNKVVPGVVDTAGGHFLKLLRATPAQVLAKIIRPERVELEAILCGLGSDEVRNTALILCI